MVQRLKCKYTTYIFQKERKTLNMKKKLGGKLLDGKGEGATIALLPAGTNM